MISNLYDNAGLESCILVGDFNHPEIDWTNESCACHTDHPASKFLETEITFDLKQWINPLIQVYKRQTLLASAISLQLERLRIIMFCFALVYLFLQTYRAHQTY